jgi:prepilin-type N-terminal cleavage/methylation domain-containing protein
MKTRANNRRGFTIVELLISMTILGLVLGLAIIEFAMVFNHNNLMNANLTADQNARIAMAKVTNELRQAMPDITDSSTGTIVVTPTAPPPSTAPAPVTTVSFYRVHNGAGGLVTPVPTSAAGDPTPCYDLVTLTYDPVAKTISKTVTLQTNAICTTASTATTVLARNIVGFGVTAETATLFDVDLQTVASNGNYGIYDLNSQVAMGYKP